MTPQTRKELGNHERLALLDKYFAQVDSVMLSRQHPVSGLLPASTAKNAHGDYTDAWVRDNVYSVLAVWGLGLAYRKLDANDGRAYLLEQSTVKLMRGLLLAMMRQADKVERFKYSQRLEDALHAKYDTQTGDAVVGDTEWGHLQLDATSLYLLMLAQMTASGLRVVFTLDEVDFIQNLVHYIGRAYRTPDYGIWERGNKINHGLTELNASSIGMAKAALEALRGLDLFGAQGGSRSVIHVVADEIARLRSTLESLLPRESGSKEVDAALLSVIGFPAFAVEDAELVARTRGQIVTMLQGNYGCKRFLLDGHQTVLEDTNRLHYEAHELKRFEHIESEWPLFFGYLLLNALFQGDKTNASEYRRRLDGLVIERDGQRLLPELYYVPAEHIAREKIHPHSQPRLPNENVPLVWAQSLYLLGMLIQDGLLDAADIDPLGRRWRIGHRPHTTIQVALLAENDQVQQQLIEYGIVSQTLRQAAPIEIRLPEELAEALSQLGRNDKLKLTGRPMRRIRSLTTSQVFRLRDNILVFLPQLLSQREFYLNNDNHLLVEHFKGELRYHQHHWDQPGRPLIVLLITATMLYREGKNVLIRLVEELQTGECNGVPVRMGRLAELIPTSAKRRLDYLRDYRFPQPPQEPERKPVFRLKYDPMKTRPLTAAQEEILQSIDDAAELAARLLYSDNPYQQSRLLKQMHAVLGPDYPIPIQDESVTVGQLTEELYRRAVQHQLWMVVRQTAGLLGKMDPTLEDAVTELLVRQKQVGVGRSYDPDSLITHPLTNREIMQRIASLGHDNELERTLTQEMLIFLGALIRAEPALFSNIMTLRTGHLILLLAAEMGREFHLSQDGAFDLLLQLSPFDVQARLRKVLAAYSTAGEQLLSSEALHHAPLEGGLRQVFFPPGNDPIMQNNASWRTWREHNGVIGRVGNQFFARVWNLLGHCHGIVIGDKFDRLNRLDAALRNEMTSNEKNFALRVEHLLNKIQAPEFRQLSIEALTALDVILGANPELSLDDDLVLDVIIGHAVRLAWLKRHPDRQHLYDRERAGAWRHFYNLPPHSVANAVMAAFAFLLQAGNSAEIIETDISRLAKAEHG